MSTQISAGTRFGEFLLDRGAGGLFRVDQRGDPVPVSLGSRAFDVLCVLVEAAGKLVSKQAIMDAVWPSTAVEENNLTVQISALRRVLDEGRSEGSCIQTVPGRGYRFVLSVRRDGESGEVETQPAVADTPPLAEASGDPVPTATTEDTTRPVAASRRRGAMWAAALAGICLAIGALLVFMRTDFLGTGTTDRPRLSIVVLPFDNLSGDPKDDYLADGITDDLTSDLAHLSGAFVIARQSAFTYKGKPRDVRRIGEELGVRYVLEGSVRKLASELRVNAQLVATETGAHLWADRFDQSLMDLGACQEEIVRRIAQTLNVTVTDIESARSKRERPTNPDAYDLVLRAQSLYLHTTSPNRHAERMELLEQALRIDPASIPAMMGLADELINNRLNFGLFIGDSLERAEKLVASAAALNPNDAHVLATTAFLLRAQDRYTESISAYRYLLENYPNYAVAYKQIGKLLTFTGRADEAIPMIETAIRLDPRSPDNWSRYGELGFALLMLGRHEDAIAWNHRALAATSDAMPFRAQLYLRLAASYARLGHTENAHHFVAAAKQSWPYDTVRSHWPDDPTNRVHAAQIASFQEALRLAGHRDHAEEDADFGVAVDDTLHADLAGLTPIAAPGVTTVRTYELQRLLTEKRLVIIDTLQYSYWGRSVTGAVGLKNAGWGGSLTDAMQNRLRSKMRELTDGDLNQPIVAVGWNSERFDGRNLALRLVALGYTQVYWYRGGREAWEVNGLPETELDVQPW
ncbi:MAG TPA: winged helix-turn-helix domain-containing protein [Acetobacteraceae bacterium]|nr:winged helix-turn-helix domain-containing protein [Acetobacteraceae bacterium]